MVRVLFLFLTGFHVNVARSNGNPTWRAFQSIVSTASCCDLPQRQYFEDLFNENGGVFSYDKNPHLPQNYKKQCSLGKVQKELKSFRIDGDPKKRKRVAICKQLFPASSLPVRRGASENFPSKN